MFRERSTAELSNRTCSPQRYTEKDVIWRIAPDERISLRTKTRGVSDRSGGEELRACVGVLRSLLL